MHVGCMCQAYERELDEGGMQSGLLCGKSAPACPLTKQLPFLLTVSLPHLPVC